MSVCSARLPPPAPRTATWRRPHKPAADRLGAPRGRALPRHATADPSSSRLGDHDDLQARVSAARPSRDCARRGGPVPPGGVLRGPLCAAASPATRATASDLLEWLLRQTASAALRATTRRRGTGALLRLHSTLLPFTQSAPPAGTSARPSGLRSRHARSCETMCRQLWSWGSLASNPHRAVCLAVDWDNTLAHNDVLICGRCLMRPCSLDDEATGVLLP